MDDRTFDQLTRVLAGAASRRQVLKRFGTAIVGSVAGAMTLRHVGATVTCVTPVGGRCSGGTNPTVCDPDSTCQGTGTNSRCCPENSTLTSGSCCCDSGYTLCNGVCIPVGACCTAADCPTPDNACEQATCVNNACGTAPVTDGTACNDGNACTQTDTCQAGVCVGSNPIVCTPLDQCHVAGTCDTTTGQCSNPAVANGAPCNDGNACTQTDTCQSGACVGGNPVVCTPLDQCHVAGTCDPNTGTCSNPDAPDDTPCNDGNLCTTGDTCQAGTCTGGASVVCTPSGSCVTASCDSTLGCVETPKDAGTACDDATLCNGHETCDGAGACVAGTPVNCGPCLICNGANGSCQPDPDQVGQSCPGDDNLCHGGFQCTAAGTCAPTTSITCTASDPCHDVGTCQPATGVCSNPNAADDTPCNDGDACTRTDTCQSGVCTGGNPVDCSDLDDQCTTGVCNSVTGLCGAEPVDDDTPCDDGDACTENDVCTSGACAGTPVDCSDLDDQCATGVCNPGSGSCETVAANEGETCGTAGTCHDGTCVEACPPGFADCDDDDGSCATDLMQSAANCGACGHKCAPRENCRAGICIPNRGHQS